MMLLTVADVALRAAFNWPIRGVYELVELLLAGTFFVALPAVFLRDENIVVNVDRRYGAALRCLGSSASRELLAVGVLAVMAWQGCIAARDSLRVQRRHRRSRPAAVLALAARCCSASSARRWPRSSWRSRARASKDAGA